jgi:hypothetical protein
MDIEKMLMKETRLLINVLRKFVITLNDDDKNDEGLSYHI